MDSITKEELFNKAQERFNTWIKMYTDPNVTAEQMYEDMSCSCYSGSIELDTEGPVLDQNLCFKYKGYDFELSSCTNITSKDQIIGLTDENIDARFPHGIFTDRYICWMYGHKDIEGHARYDFDAPKYWAPMVYLIPEAWYYGVDFDLVPGNKVAKYVIESIDKFLETFKE